MTPEHGLYTAEIRLTKNCNLSCRHCSVNAGPSEETFLELDSVKEFLDQLAKMEVPYVVFTGGEPLLYEDLPELVEYASRLGLHPSVDTNGSLLSRDLAKSLKDGGVEVIQISLEGSKNTHERIRGKGSFEKALKGIENALEAGLYTTINFTISRLNKDELPLLIELAKKLGVQRVSMERLAPIGRGERLSKELLSPEEFRMSLITLFQVQDMQVSSTDPLALFLKKKVLERYSEDDLNSRICGGCTAGVAALTISYDGEVYPCPKLEISCGNAKNQSLMDIWYGSPVLQDLRYRRLRGRCEPCRFRNLCGGCRAVAHGATGDHLGSDPTCFIGGEAL